MLLPFILILSLLLPQAQEAPAHVNLIFVSPPGESWTQAERDHATGAVLDATAWWVRNSPTAVPSFELGWTQVITPADFSYTVFGWQQPYYAWPTNDLTVFVIDNSASHRTMGGAVGWAQVPCKAITVLLSGQENMAFVIAHEYGHAVLDLEHAPLAAFDIMSPAAALETYRTNTIGYNTRLAMGETFRKVYLGVVAR